MQPKCVVCNKPARISKQLKSKTIYAKTCSKECNSKLRSQIATKSVKDGKAKRLGMW